MLAYRQVRHNVRWREDAISVAVQTGDPVACGSVVLVGRQDYTQVLSTSAALTGIKSMGLAFRIERPCKK